MLILLHYTAKIARFSHSHLGNVGLKLGGAGAVEMWQDTLGRLQGLDPGIGEIEQLKQIRAEVRSRMGRFVNLAPGDNSTAFFASDLTREHLREVVRLFIAAQPGQHLVPFGRLGTGSINLWWILPPLVLRAVGAH